MTIEELKPCPFCEGKAAIAKTYRGWKVECEGRFGSCLMNARTHYQPDKASAFRAWNTRTPDFSSALIKVRDIAEDAKRLCEEGHPISAFNLATKILDALAQR